MILDGREGRIVDISYTERTGEPFWGRDKERLVRFLRARNLDYDELITWTILLELDGEIIATGSCHNNVLKCIAVEPKYRGQGLLNVILSALAGHLCEQGITHYFGFTKPKNKDIFCSLGLYPAAETTDVLLLENVRDGLKNYLELLKKETKKAEEEGTENPDGEGIGAVVANCNPVTLGHAWLFAQAAKKCRWLHIFILSQEQDFLTSGERFDLVRAAVKEQNLSDIILHHTSDYLISPATFPTYFMKDKASAYTRNCELDIELFGSIAKTLGITKRYVGNEPFCELTGWYNRCLEKELPDRGIQLIELNRKKKNGVPISASAVRRAFENGNPETVRNLVSPSVWKYLQSRLPTQNRPE